MCCGTCTQGERRAGGDGNDPSEHRGACKVAAPLSYGPSKGGLNLSKRKALLQAPDPPAPTGPVPDVIHLTVYGHARPSVRITKATKWSPEARAYLDWQKLVCEYCIQIRPRPLPWQYFRVDMLFYFADDNHGDRINLGKSTEDGLAWGGVFPRKRLKSGRLSKKPDDSCIHDGNVGIRWCDHSKDERVEITITEHRREGA